MNCKGCGRELSWSAEDCPGETRESHAKTSVRGWAKFLIRDVLRDSLFV
jgi:hypothetical protein